VTHADIEPWRRPEETVYFRASQATYYESTRRASRGGGLVAAIVGAMVASDGILGWAAWSAHQACLHGNAHSVLAEGVVAAVSVGSAGLAITGLTSKTDRGSWLGAVFSPISLLLAGFGVLLWAPGWSASMVITLMEGVLDAGLVAVGVNLKREERKYNHEAGMQHDAIAGDLQKNYDTQKAKTERKALKYRAWFHIGRIADDRVDRTVYDLHTRHPEIVPAPERYAGRELPAGQRPLAITSGAETELADDWMALADVLYEHVENR
jgi:hypothetical protein